MDEETQSTFGVGGHYKNNLSMEQSLVQDTMAGSSLLEPSHMTTRVTRKRKQQRSPSTSNYMRIPTENLKFEKFLAIIFNSKMQKMEMRDEIGKYAQALETNYTEAISNLKL